MLTGKTLSYSTIRKCQKLVTEAPQMTARMITRRSVPYHFVERMWSSVELTLTAYLITPMEIHVPLERPTQESESCGSHEGTNLTRGRKLPSSACKDCQRTLD